MIERLLKEYEDMSKEDLIVLFEYLSLRGFLIITRGSNDPSLELIKWKGGLFFNTHWFWVS